MASPIGHPSLQTQVKLHLPSCLQQHWLCQPCCILKSHKLSFPSSISKTCNPLELIYSDVWRPSPLPSYQDYKYYISFINDFSCFTWVYPLKQKSEIFHLFMHFMTYVERYFNRPIKILHSEAGGEYMSHKFQHYLQKSGIIHQLSSSYTSKQNGVVERKYLHLLETACVVLHDAKLPYKF